MKLDRKELVVFALLLIYLGNTAALAAVDSADSVKQQNSLSSFERICTSGTPAELKQMLDKISADVVFSSGNRPLHLAAEHATAPEMIALLLKNGASLDAVGLEKLTPLMLASAYNPNDKITEALLNAGAKVNAADGQGRTPLYLASASNQANVVAVLLRHGAKAEVRDKVGRSPLYIAAMRADKDIIRLLLDTGAKVDTPDDTGVTPLLLASERPDADLIRLFTEAGANPHVRAKNRYTPLMNAIAAGADAKTIDVFIKGKSDVKAEDDQNQNALMLAAARQNTPQDVLEVLVKAGANPNSINFNFSTPLMELCRQKNVEGVKYILSAGAKPELRDKSSWTAILHAASKGAPKEIFEALLKAGAKIDDITPQGFSPLMTAIEGNASADTIAALLSLGADPNHKAFDSVTVLMTAIATDNRNGIDLLLTAGADPNLPTWDGLTPLMLVAQRTVSPDVIHTLVKAGANVDKKSEQGMTPLMVAASIGNVEGVKALLAESADINAQDIAGATPLICSVLSREENAEVIKILINASADIDKADDRGTTSLMQACVQGRTQTAKLLLDAGAKADAHDVVGWTAVHYAANDQALDILRMLIEKDKNLVDMPDTGGTTPLMVAASYDNYDAVSLLLRSGASRIKTDNTGRSAYDYAIIRNATKALTAFEEQQAQENTPQPIINQDIISRDIISQDISGKNNQ